MTLQATAVRRALARVQWTAWSKVCSSSRRCVAGHPPAAAAPDARFRLAGFDCCDENSWSETSFGGRFPGMAPWKPSSRCNRRFLRIKTTLVNWRTISHKRFYQQFSITVLNYATFQTEHFEKSLLYSICRWK